MDTGPRSLTFFRAGPTIVSFGYSSPRGLVKQITHCPDRKDFEHKQGASDNYVYHASYIRTVPGNLGHTVTGV